MDGMPAVDSVDCAVSEQCRRLESRLMLSGHENVFGVVKRARMLNPGVAGAI